VVCADLLHDDLKGPPPARAAESGAPPGPVAGPSLPKVIVSEVLEHGRTMAEVAKKTFVTRPPCSCALGKEMLGALSNHYRPGGSSSVATAALAMKKARLPAPKKKNAPYLVGWGGRRVQEGNETVEGEKGKGGREPREKRGRRAVLPFSSFLPGVKLPPAGAPCSWA